MQSELRDLLTGNGPLTALVPAASIIWNHLPQTTPRPAIVLYMISGAPGLTMQGSDNLQGSTVQIDVQALSMPSVVAIRNAVVALLHGYRGGSFQLISMQSERQDSDELAGGGGLIHRASLDFSVWHSA